jgi:hypothetical protein
MPSLPCREKALEYGRLSMKELRKFLRVAAIYYNYPQSPFCMRMYEAMHAMNPYFFLGKDFLHFEDGPLKSHDADEAKSQEILSVFASPVVPALESILADFPFHMAFNIDPATRMLHVDTEVGDNLFRLTPRLSQALYESFYRGLLGPISSPDQFVPDILSRPNISGPGPIFIMGSPRTGTSLVQFLLSLDKKHNRSPTNWEFKTPASILSDKERIKFATIESSLSEHPRWREIQAEHPAEDNVLFELVGAMSVAPQDNEAQDWARWNLNRDHIALLCMHRLIIRLLECQAKHRGGHDVTTQWIFKDPTHMGHNLEAIVKVYPNARFIWMHRNLSDMVSSVFRSSPQLDNSRAFTIAYVAALLSFQNQGMAFRQSGKYLEDGDFHLDGEKHKSYNSGMPPESQEHRFHDIFLDDLHADFVGEIRKLYQKWDMPFTEEYEVAIREWEASSEKRDAIESKKFPPGFEDLHSIGVLMMKNRDYFRRFPRTTPKMLHVIGLLNDEL